MRFLQKAVALVCAAGLLTACAADGQGIGSAASNASAPFSVPGPVTPVESWYVQVRPQIGQLEQSITYAQRVVRRPEHHGLNAACRAIRTDVTLVRAAPDSPDAAVRQAVTRETDAFDAAATQCLAGDYRQAGRSVNVGHHWAEVGGRRLRALLHLPPKAGALL